MPPLLYALRTATDRRGLIPNPISGVQTVRLTITATGALVHQLGYCWASNLATLEEASVTGWDYAPSSEDESRSGVTSEGATIPVNPVVRSSFTVSFPYLSTQDALALRALHLAAGSGRPFCFLRPDENGAERFEREAEGGIVHLGQAAIMTQNRGILGLNALDSRQIERPLTLYHWR